MYQSIYDYSIVKTIGIIGIDLCQAIMNNIAEEFNYLQVPKAFQNMINHGILRKKTSISIGDLFLKKMDKCFFKLSNQFFYLIQYNRN